MSGTARKTLRNTALLSAFEVANPLLSLALVGTLARKLGPEGMGGYNLVLTFFYIAHALTSLGLSPLITREVARHRDSAGRILCSATVLGLPISLIVAVGMVASVRMGGYGPDVTQAAFLAAFALLPSIVYLHAESLLIAMERVDVMVLVAVLENAGRVIVGLGLLVSGFGIGALMGAFVLFRLLATIAMLIFLHRKVRPLRWEFDAQILQDLSRNILVFGGILLASTLYQSIDVLILSRLSDIESVGFYSAAYRLMTIAMVVPKSFNTTIYPVFSRLFHESSQTFKKANSLSLRYLLVLLIPVAVAVCGTADSLVPVLLGEKMVPATGALKVLIWTLVPYGIARVLASLLVASNRQRLDLAVNGIALATNIGLNFTLIPKFGFIGCSWANLLSMIVFLAVQCYFLRHEILDVVRDAQIARPLLVSGLLWGWFQLTGPLSLFIRLPGGALLYVLLLICFRVVPWQELKMVLPNRLMSAVSQERQP